MVMDEIWKDIDGYEGIYQISNIGRCRSLDRHIINVDGIKKFRSGIFLKLSHTKDGYGCYVLSINNNRKFFLAHQLIAKAFIPNPENKPYVNHKNGIKYDNDIENLEWVTPRENQIHAYATGLKTSAHTGKLGYESVKGMEVFQYDMRLNLIGIFGSGFDAARKTGVDQSSICKCCLGKVAHAEHFIWKYEQI